MGGADVCMDAPRGFEPRLTESESVVLPLDDGAIRRVAIRRPRQRVKSLGGTVSDAARLPAWHSFARLNVRQRRPRGGPHDNNGETAWGI